MNRKKLAKKTGRILIFVGCLALIIAVAAAQPALAQQAAPKRRTDYPQLCNFFSWISPGNGPVLTRDSSAKRWNCPKAGLLSGSAAARKLLRSSIYPRQRRAELLIFRSTWPVLWRR